MDIDEITANTMKFIESEEFQRISKITGGNMKKYHLQMFKASDSDVLSVFVEDERRGGHYIEGLRNIIGRWLINERMGYVYRNNGLDRSLYSDLNIFFVECSKEYDTVLKDLIMEEKHE